MVYKERRIDQSGCHDFTVTRRSNSARLRESEGETRNTRCNSPRGKYKLEDRKSELFREYFKYQANLRRASVT